MAMDEVKALATSRRAAMVAAAGFGKTELIALGVARYCTGRELVLTHTHAGVNALRERLIKLGVRSNACRVDTIAGWALRLAAAFPRTSEIPLLEPRNNADHVAVCRAATRALTSKPVQEVVRCSYSGVYVDEYQDCTVEQHDLVRALGSLLPCRVVGDPMQRIFDFGSNQPVSWERDVNTYFDDVAGPTTPWRWAKTNPALGEWLKHVRRRLEAGEDVNLIDAPSDARVHWLPGADDAWALRLEACRDAARNSQDRVIAIHHLRQKCYAVAGHLQGLYSCIERIDEEDLFKAASQIQEARGLARAMAVLEFVEKCVANIKGPLGTIKNALAAGRMPRVKKHRECLQALVAIRDDSLVEVLAALREVSRVGYPYRRELLKEMERAIEAVIAGEAADLSGSISQIRDRTRRYGRRLWKRSIGTTLLVKGLEFERAVVLDASSFRTPQDLYVALTRASRSLTVVSASPVIRSSELKSRKSADRPLLANRRDG